MSTVVAGTRREEPAEGEQESTGFELCFHSLIDTQRAMSFPCDAAGRVDIDALSEQARHDYLYARAVIGRVFGRPAVRPH